MSMRPMILWIPLLIGATTVTTANAQEILGSWKNVQYGHEMTLVLKADGTGSFDNESLAFRVAQNILSITIDGHETDYIYSVNGKTLGLVGGNLEGTIIFTLVAQNELAKGEVAPVFSLTDTGLIGLWSGNGEMIAFQADGTCGYLGKTFSYKVSSDHIVINTDPGTVTFEYKLLGKQLTLTANGQRAVYHRPDGSQGKKSLPADRIPWELVGQWCYLNMNSNAQSSRCITLNENGTYVYAAESSRSVNTNEFSGGTSSQANDNGTWYVEGDRIFYHSRVSGAGSYKLEKRNHPQNVNDPMIVLDGDAFVTATQRPPWK